MNDATRPAHQATHPASLRLPVEFAYPLAGILGRTAIGLALITAAVAMLARESVLWAIAGLLPGSLGALAVISNLGALLDPERRKIVLDDEGVEIRYGFSRRRYRFLDYSDYRIARLGLRRFLTALPVDVEHALGARAARVRVTLYDRPAFLTPMPLLGGGAPATLLEWQSTLNELRRAAVASAGSSVESAQTVGADEAEEARRAAVWQARAQAGARPSRLSRAGYGRGRAILALVFLVVLLSPLGFVAAIKYGLVAVCGAAAGAGCLAIDPALQQAVMIGAPLLAVLVFVLGSAWLTVRRAHDLDEEMPFWRAALGSVFRHRALGRRLSREEGTAGTNRFGPAAGG